MPIKWKSSQRFKPSLVLQKIDAARSVNPNGGASFSGFEWGECLPALHSMLSFPPVAKEIDAHSLVWEALTKVCGPLTPIDFLNAANAELTKRLATKEEQYHLLTTISVRLADIPKKISCLGANINFLAGPFPRRYKGRDALIIKHRINVPEPPISYARVIVSVKAKSHDAAVSKAMRALDLQRSLWCLMGNPSMQITFGMPSWKPINVVRLGGPHTLHRADGTSAREGLWFDPGYVEAPLFGFKNAAVIKSNCRWALQRLRLSRYGEQLTSALVRYVRALDESDTNTAFLRLWAVIESLTTPEVADYDKLVRRCAFLFQESDFHRQMLEHLREYRNDSVHAGEYSKRERTLCFQLQLYFNALIWFHIRNAKFFTSLDEANQFLDTPPDKLMIGRKVKLARKALQFLA